MGAFATGNEGMFMPAKIRQEAAFNSDGSYLITPHEKNVEPYLQDSGYRLAIWEHEADVTNATFELRTYAIPANDKDIEATRRSLHAFSPTIAYVTSDRKFVAVRFVDADGTVRPWNDFRSISIGMEGKIAKRLGMTGTWTHMNKVSRVRIVTDDAYYPHTPGVITVRVLPTPAHLEKDVDGSFWIREELRQELYLEALDRTKDEDKRDLLAEKLMDTDAYNARFVLPDFTIKGDAEVSRNLDADVVVYDCNLFYSITMNDANTGIFMLTPQEQDGSVRTNRQSIAHFWDLLFAVRTPVYGPTLGLVQDAFLDYVNSEIQSFIAGEPMSFINSVERKEDDQIRSLQAKAERWVESGLSLNMSPYLMMALASQRVVMWEPSEELIERNQADKKRTKLPAPFSRRYSLRNEFSIQMTRLINPMLGRGNAYVDKLLGLIVNSEDWADVIEALGGADKDDHVEIHYREALSDFTFRGIEFKAGDTLLFLIRSPIGMLSDGERIASEYYILRPTADYEAEITERYGQLPLLDPALLPMHILDLEESFPAGTVTRENTTPDLPESYTKRYLWDSVLSASRAQYVYDKHSATRRKMKLLDIPFSPYDENGLLVKEEFFIDEVAQVRSPEGLSWINEHNEDEKKLLPEDMPPTILDVLSLFQADQVRRFKAAAESHIFEMQGLNRQMFADVEVTRWSKGVPILVARAEKYVKARRVETNAERRPMRYSDFELVGNRIMARLAEMELMEASIQTPELTTQDFIEAHAWLQVNAVKSNYKNPELHEMLTNTDQRIMMGAMFERVIQTLGGKLI